MTITIYAGFGFTDSSDNCGQNGDLSIRYEVPKSWPKWSNKKKAE